MNQASDPQPVLSEVWATLIEMRNRADVADRMAEMVVSDPGRWERYHFEADTWRAAAAMIEPHLARLSHRLTGEL
jgi:hypothetical protein